MNIYNWIFNYLFYDNDDDNDDNDFIYNIYGYIR